ncbi:MAG: hypothetical protein ACFE0J_21045 [Elainellaceae cyanobacterium]
MTRQCDRPYRQKLSVRSPNCIERRTCILCLDSSAFHGKVRSHMMSTNLAIEYTDENP